MRTFQFSDAKSHKFWTIEVSGNSFTVTYGKVGTAGQTQTKSFASPEQGPGRGRQADPREAEKGLRRDDAEAGRLHAEAFEQALAADPHDRAPPARTPTTWPSRATRAASSCTSRSRWRTSRCRPPSGSSCTPGRRSCSRSTRRSGSATGAELFPAPTGDRRARADQPHRRPQVRVQARPADDRPLRRADGGRGPGVRQGPADPAGPRAVHRRLRLRGEYRARAGRPRRTRRKTQAA